jgi:AcrR family transcriptional regulator
MSSSSRSAARRDEILAAAVRVFAGRGFHTCRVSDVAREAGVSHGLVYHYFASKDELLETIFRENWGPTATAIEAIAAADDEPSEQIRKVTAVVLHSWRRDQDTVRVLVREISRSPGLQERIDEFQRAFDALETIIVRGQAAGAFDAELDPRFATYALWGTLDEILTGWVLGRLPGSDGDAARAEATVTAMLRRALSAGS